MRVGRNNFEEKPIVSEDQTNEARLSESRRRGETDAEAVDLRLRVSESAARERRIIERLLRAEAALEEMKRADEEQRARLERYARFHGDLQRSLAWRALQFVRRLIGREW